jgi:S-adenosylmethionine:tRNA ribosyltransferase-isomerase
MIDTEDELAAAYSFELPQHLIAQTPASERDGSRLLVLRDNVVEHRTFRDLPEILHTGDLLVLNDTRVIAARLYCDRDRRREVLLLRPSDRERYDPASTHWLALVKPGKKMRAGASVEFFDQETLLARATVTGVHGQDGVRELAFTFNVPFEELLARAGRLPLPPYIHNESTEAQERYQTVFARADGSVAAPTAALHFTAELLEALVARGVQLAYLTLDVGLGTFRPMQGEHLSDHLMHAESYALPQPTVDAISQAKREGRRVIAVGTTVVRALEGNALANDGLTAGRSSTNCFITPGFQFRVIDALITNFHLPKSTLLVLVSAFMGRGCILQAYAEAVRREYRFFSFGDAMFLEPPRA